MTHLNLVLFRRIRTAAAAKPAPKSAAGLLALRLGGRLLPRNIVHLPLRQLNETIPVISLI